jgi:hypothetical protein
MVVHQRKSKPSTWKVNNGSMFAVLVFASYFEILVRKPDTSPEYFTPHLVA